jgi:hypothetical protein
MKSSLVVKHSVVIAGHRTSISVEDAFWKGLKKIARDRDMALYDLVAVIDSERKHSTYHLPFACSCSTTIAASHRRWHATPLRPHDRFVWEHNRPTIALRPIVACSSRATAIQIPSPSATPSDLLLKPPVTKKSETFVTPSKKGRPPLGNRPMSPAERKRRQRILDKS